jgi:hypothetical protein
MATTEAEINGTDKKPDADAQQDAKKKQSLFSRRDVKPFVPVKCAWPEMWPQTEEQPFELAMRLQLIKEAQSAQRDFLALEDVDRDAQTFDYDVECIALLSVKPPKGFPEFPEIEVDERGYIANPEAAQNSIRDYFHQSVEADPESREGWAWLVRQLMSRYWVKVTPKEYL